LPLALPHPGSYPGWKSRKLSYSYVNENWGQVTLSTIDCPRIQAHIPAEALARFVREVFHPGR
jgi:hypothetical protein